MNKNRIVDTKGVPLDFDIQDRKENGLGDIKDPLGFLKAGSKYETPTAELKILSHDELLEIGKRFRPKNAFVCVIPQRINPMDGSILKSDRQLQQEKEGNVKGAVLVVAVGEQATGIVVGNWVIISAHAAPDYMENVEEAYQVRFYNAFNVITEVQAPVGI